MDNSTIIKAIAVVLAIAGLSTFVFFAYNPISGSPLAWDAGTKEPVLQYYPVGQNVYLVTSGNVSLVNSTGQSLWSVSFSAPLYSALGSDGRLYVYSASRSLWRISPAGAAEAVGSYVIDRPPVVDGNGTAYLRSGANLTAIGPRGTVLWSDTSVTSDPVLDEAGNVYYLTCLSGQPTDVFLKIRSPGGSLQCSSLLSNYDESTAILPHSPGGVYVSRSSAGELYRVLENGTTMWKYYKPYLGRYLCVSDEAGQLYLVYDQGTVHVLDDQGEMISKFMLGSADKSAIVGAAAQRGTLYVATRGGGQAASIDVCATDLNGTRQWKVALNSTGTVQMAATGSAVCVATEVDRNGHSVPVLYVLDDRGGQQYAYYADAGGKWDRICATGSTLYARAQDGRFYALKLPG